MSDLKLTPRAALHGAKATAALSTKIDIIDGWSMALISERKGQRHALMEHIARLFGLNLPERPAIAAHAGVCAVWAGPGQWLLVASDGTGRDLERELRNPLEGLAAVADQSDSRAVVRVAGPQAKDVLAKGIPLDLHPRSFKVGDAAITHAAHIGVLMWRPLDDNGFIICCASSYAESFWDWLIEACGETGHVIG